VYISRIGGGKNYLGCGQRKGAGFSDDGTELCFSIKYEKIA
jgi:hypothetical protein